MSHQAGRPTDQNIVERLQAVLARLTAKQLPGAASQVVHPSSVPPFTTDLKAAWQLVEHLDALEFEFALMTTPKDRAQLGKWTCTATNGTIEVRSAAATAPLAISRAMLGVLGQLERA